MHGVDRNTYKYSRIIHRAQPLSLFKHRVSTTSATHVNGLPDSGGWDDDDGDEEAMKIESLNLPILPHAESIAALVKINRVKSSRPSATVAIAYFIKAD